MLLLAPLLVALAAHPTTLVLDARDGGLRDAAGHAAGRYALHCTGARCAGRARTADGRLAFAGGAHVWRITGGSGAYRGARGTVRAWPVSDTEDVVSARLRTEAPLRAGVVRVRRSAAAEADRRCGQAARALAALPAFPFTGFDPLHPDPALLPQVGAFFTGPGDPRPILRALHVRALHEALAGEVAVRDRQDAAALRADVPAFVRTVRATTRAFRREALAALVLGAPRCVL